MKYVISLVTAFCLSTAAVASTITYNLNQQIGTSTATGTITTDGTLGILSTGNILGFTLTVANGSSSDIFTSGYTNALGSDLTATADALYFNFSGMPGRILFADTGSGRNELCFTVPSVPCNSSTGTVITVFGDTTSDTSSTGTRQIGSVATTPEPGTLLLLGTGILGVAGVVRRRVTAS